MGKCVKNGGRGGGNRGTRGRGHGKGGLNFFIILGIDITVLSRERKK